MKQHEIIERSTKVLKDVICDKCGKSCKETYNFEGLFASTIGGYDSWYDDFEISIDLCQYCLKNFLMWIYPDKTLDEIMNLFNPA